MLENHDAGITKKLSRTADIFQDFKFVVQTKEGIEKLSYHDEVNVMIEYKSNG